MFTNALVSASQVCHTGYRIILDSLPGQSGLLHNYTVEWIGVREEKGVFVFDGWFSSAMTAGRNRSTDLSLTPYEHNLDVAPVDFPGRRAIRNSSSRRSTHEPK